MCYGILPITYIILLIMDISSDTFVLLLLLLLYLFVVMVRHMFVVGFFENRKDLVQNLMIDWAFPDTVKQNRLNVFGAKRFIRTFFIP